MNNNSDPLQQIRRMAIEAADWESAMESDPTDA